MLDQEPSSNENNNYECLDNAHRDQSALTSFEGNVYELLCLHNTTQNL